MELFDVEITAMAITAQYGTLQTGAILRTDAAFAKHLVEDCKAAKYRNLKAPTEAPTEATALEQDLPKAAKTKKAEPEAPSP